MPPVCDHCLLRGRWTDGQTFLIDFPAVKENNTTEIQAKFTGQSVEITIQPLIFAAQPVVFSGIQQ
jgi:hypothetical protein